MTEKNITINQQPTTNNDSICVHLVLQSIDAKNGYNTYETEITRRLLHYNDLKADPFHLHLKPVDTSSVDFHVRHVIFPSFLAFRQSNYGIRAVLGKIFSIIDPLFSLNHLVGGKSEDTYVFFENNITSLPVKGKIIALIHDLIPLKLPEYIKHDNYERIKKSFGIRVKEIISRASKIITVSDFSKRDIAEYFHIDVNRIEVVHCGIKPEKFSCERSSGDYLRNLKAKYNLPEKYILHFGSCLPQKNVETLIKAYSMLPDKIRNEYVLMITNPNDSVKRFAESNDIAQRVIYAEDIPESDKPGIYQLASLFVWPSLYEGFGIPVLEAMASGVPVICSNSTSMPEVAGDAAILVDPLDDSGMSKEIEHVLTDSDLRNELIAKGYENIKRFSWDNSAKKVHDIIMNLQ